MDIFMSLSNMLCLILHVTDTDAFPKPLSKKEETVLLEKLSQGDESAKKKLIEHNLRLVAHVVKKYYANYSEQDDLISIGTIGLIKGVNSFKAEKGTKLATYCARCIENEILMYFRNNKKLSQEISFSDPIDTDSEGNPLTLMDIIAIDDTIVDDIDTKNKLIRLSEIVNSIKNQRDKTILVKRYGLDGSTPLTQKEIAKELNISRSYVSRIEKRMLEEIKELI
ncbi:MAG: RNA polymerase sporulation sigma factor SigK [Acutalibacteraceae bacterium]|nr:RNA polymerase sporulation sigma factor SigK [Acutalibacteraceae bacterium]